MEKQIVFTAFEKDNLVDKLLEKFKIQGWDINDVKSIYHYYHWPTIILSEEKPKFTIFSTIEQTIQSDEVDSENCNSSIDLLGQYFPVEKEVRLYLLAIEEAAIRYTKLKNNKDIKALIEQITLIVLIHEISHWLVISVKDENKNSFFDDVKKEGLLYKDIEQVNFHEGLAQYLTWYILKENNVDMTLFNWLNKNAPKQYQVYSEIIDESIETVILTISLSRKDIIQDWNKFKDLFFTKRGCIKTKKYGI